MWCRYDGGPARIWVVDQPIKVARGQIEEKPDKESPAAELGHKGGIARSKAMTKERRSEIAKKLPRKAGPASLAGAGG
jgi:general stress protein YciG